jgi:hypothetical protein
MTLVHYKKRDAKNNGSFYPDSDSNLASEIQRMQEVLAALFGEDMPQSKRNTESGTSYDVADHGWKFSGAQPSSPP